MDFTIRIVSQNLATTSNFVEYQNSRNLHVFRDNESSTEHFAHFEWLIVCHMSGAE